MFTTDTRSDGTTFVKMADDAPDWVQEMVQEAHDGELPNDWRYETLAHLWDVLSADPDADTFETADALADTYHPDLASWLADYSGRSGYCEEAYCEYGPDFRGDPFELIRLGQFHCIRQMAEIVAEAIRSNR